MKVKLRVGEAVWPRVLMIWGGSFGQVLVIYGHFEGCHMCIRADLLPLLVKQTSL